MTHTFLHSFATIYAVLYQFLPFFKQVFTLDPEIQDFGHEITLDHSNSQILSNFKHSPDDGFRIIEHADFPARFDYSCTSSKAEWGCVFSIKHVGEARKKCELDRKCKAFVVMPHLRKPGWNIVVFKNDVKQPVDHKGTTVFIKLKHENSKIQNSEKNEKILLENSKIGQDTEHAPNTCDSSTIIREILTPEFKAFKTAHETKLISNFGEKSIPSDRAWLEFLTTAQVSKNREKSVFEPTGSGCTGGQVKLTLANSVETTFSAKRDRKSGCQVFDVLQLAMFYVDRILGFYSVPPCAVRTLSMEEMKIAGFPVDIGGDYFDRFKSYKNGDGGLTGVVCLNILKRNNEKEVEKTRFLKLTKFSSFVNGITFPTFTQKSQVEYLMLAWVCGINGFLDVREEKMSYFPETKYSPFNWKMLHLNGENGFEENSHAGGSSFNDFEEVRMYLNNCWFPKEVYHRMIQIRESECSLGTRVQVFLDAVYGRVEVGVWEAVELKVGGKLADKIDVGLNGLTDVVDGCLKKHGEQIFYD